MLPGVEDALKKSWVLGRMYIMYVCDLGSGPWAWVGATGSTAAHSSSPVGES